MRTILLSSFTIIAAIFLAPWVLRVAGYYVDNPGWEVARIAVTRKNPDLCKKIIVISHFFGPTSTERQRECLFDYASLTLDYSACKTLLPSDYGFSCLGEVAGKIFEGQPCSFSREHNNVYCSKLYSEGEITIEKPQIQNCLSYSRKDLREWCHFERTNQYLDVYECGDILHPISKDYCEYTNAIKHRDPLLCNPIANEQSKEFCKFRAQMSKDYES